MTNFLEYKIDKFIFRIAEDRYYSDEGLWLKLETSYVRVGISDYVQQRSGDVAFVEVKPTGTHVAIGEELVIIETIKVNISLASPITGKVIEVNPILEKSPEAINLDPYGDGWLAVIEPDEGEIGIHRQLEPKVYLSKIQHDTKQELDNQ